MRLSSAVGAARWYQGKGSADPEVRVAATLRPPGAGAHALAVLAVGDATYVAPLDLGAGRSPTTRARSSGARSRQAAASGDDLEATAAACRPCGTRRPRRSARPVRPIGADQTHTTGRAGRAHRGQVLPPAGEGAAREPARLRALTAAGFDGVPAMHGSAELELPAARHALLLLQTYVPGTWDGFAQADRDLRAGAAPGWAPAAGRLAARMHARARPGHVPATRADLAGWRAQARALVAEAAARSDGARCHRRRRGARRRLGRRLRAAAGRAGARRPPSRPARCSTRAAPSR